MGLPMQKHIILVLNCKINTFFTKLEKIFTGSPGPREIASATVLCKQIDGVRGPYWDGFGGGKRCGKCEKPRKIRVFPQFPSAVRGPDRVGLWKSYRFVMILCRLVSKVLWKPFGQRKGPGSSGLPGPLRPFRYPSMRMLRFSGSLGAVFLGTLSFSTPSSKRALISSSVTPVPT